MFLFDENDAASERTFYRLEDLMGEEEGADITEAYIDEDGEICVYYDSPYSPKNRLSPSIVMATM